MAELELFTEEDVQEYTDAFVEKIREDFEVKGKSNDDALFFHVILQFEEFECIYGEDELKNMISDCIKICEILKKQIIETNMTVEKLREIETDITGESDFELDSINGLAKAHKILKKVMPEEGWILYNRIAENARVGGAFLLLMTGPAFITALYSVYEMLVKYHSDDPIAVAKDAPLSCIYFLSRAAMKMHSQKLIEHEKE